MPEITTRQALFPRCQVASVFGTWNDWPGYYVDRCSSGCGQVVGEAQITRPIGTLRRPGDGDAITIAGEIDPEGRWVRILHPDAGGQVTIDGAAHNPVWWGFVDRWTVQDKGGGAGLESWLCTGMAGYLARARIWSGIETAAGGGTFRNGRMPPINRLRDGDAGQTIVTVDGQGIVIPDRRRIPARTMWTIREVVELILATYGREVTGPVVTLSDPSGALNIEAPEIDLHGLSVLDALNSLMNSRNGLTWRLDGPADNGIACTLRATSTSPVAIGSTVKAAVTTASVDLTGNPFITAANVSSSYESQYKRIVVEGDHPWVCLTVCYTASGELNSVPQALRKGWTQAQEDAWDDGVRTAETETVWRRFIFDDDWNGNQWNDADEGLRNVMAADGTTTRGNGDPSAPGPTLAATRETPMGLDFSTTRDGSRQLPIALASADSGATWSALSGIADGEEQMALTIEDSPPAIVIGGPDDSAKLKDLLDGASSVLAVTIGIRESMPMRAIATGAGCQRDSGGTMTVSVPDADEIRMVTGTITGINRDSGDEAKTADNATSSYTVSDRDKRLVQTLDLLRPYYLSPTVSGDWSEGGIRPSPLPSSLVTDITTGTGTRTANALVTSVTWDYVAQSTSWATERMPPGIESVR